MPFFLFLVFVVYTLLPFSMQVAVAVGVISTASHLLVVGAVREVFTKPSAQVGLQVRDAVCNVWWADGLSLNCGEWAGLGDGGCGALPVPPSPGEGVQATCVPMPTHSFWPTLSSSCVATSRVPSTSTSCRMPPGTSSPTRSSASRSAGSCALRSASR